MDHGYHDNDVGDDYIDDNFWGMKMENYLYTIYKTVVEGD